MASVTISNGDVTLILAFAKPAMASHVVDHLAEMASENQWIHKNIRKMQNISKHPNFLWSLDTVPLKGR